jgi:hypothetical protein
VRAAINTPSTRSKKSVTIVHKGNIMKYTEGAFRDWAYELAKKEFGAVEIDGGPWCKIPEGKPGAGMVIKDAIADITLQQVLTRPTDFDVIATLNLNGDYLSDALAAQVGGIGIAPGGNINYISGHAIFEATHGTAPKYANKDMVNPGSVVLSGEMMFRYLGWTEAADLILKGLNGAIGSKRVTYDFARQMEGATEIKCSEFGDNIIAHMYEGFSWRWVVGCRLDGDSDVLDAGTFHQIEHEHHRAVRGILRAGDINRQVGVQAVTVGEQREQFREGDGLLVYGNLAIRVHGQVHDVGLLRGDGERGGGQIGLERADNLHLQRDHHE